MILEAISKIAAKVQGPRETKAGLHILILHIKVCNKRRFGLKAERTDIVAGSHSHSNSNPYVFKPAFLNNVWERHLAAIK